MARKKKQKQPKKRNPEGNVLNHAHYRKNRNLTNRKDKPKPEVDEEW